MLQTKIKSDTQKIAIENKQFFTFWDMDDTCVELVNLTIKNAHLLLPILLFQTYAPNQHAGILTNRAPSDDVVEYTVKSFREDLHHFGIDIPEEYVIFGGGENSKSKNEDFHLLEKALNELPKQLQSLRIIEGGDDFALKANEMKLLLSSLNIKKYDGKNYFLIEFLNRRYQEATHSYAFKKGVCPKDLLVLGLVDDLPNIAKAIEQLGSAFFGVQASRGGNPPKERSTKEDIYEYYQVDYFNTLANITGLSQYCENLLSGRENHKHDHPMMQMAALLYLWQTNQKDLRQRIIEIEEQLSDLQCEQVLKMLEYIITHKISHEYAHYIPVDDLVYIFKPRADRYFLHTVIEQYNLIENKITELTPMRTKQETTPSLERSKSKMLSNLFRRPSAEKTYSPTSSTNLLVENDKEVKDLEQKKNALIKRLMLLIETHQGDISLLAAQKLKFITSRISDESSIARSPSSALSSRSTTSDANIPTMELPRRNFTPAADNNSHRMRAAASTGSLEELEVASKPVKKLGSNIH